MLPTEYTVSAYGLVAEPVTAIAVGDIDEATEVGARALGLTSWQRVFWGLGAGQLSDGAVF